MHFLCISANLADMFLCKKSFQELKKRGEMYHNKRKI
ncbi:hypothetical protein M493_10295 [Geobacillus genomosp. 3]|uniref:Uncharacterized protein n=1 Tax=Geobacillus genomosp. 3 TaxID=1921421 RepID=S5ZDN8_GEOG3|nr:hypothetical protein M493_10295 [Geobacillus genomosp. 3]